MQIDLTEDEYKVLYGMFMDFGWECPHTDTNEVLALAKKLGIKRYVDMYDEP